MVIVRIIFQKRFFVKWNVSDSDEVQRSNIMRKPAKLSHQHVSSMCSFYCKSAICVTQLYGLWDLP